MTQVENRSEKEAQHSPHHIGPDLHAIALRVPRPGETQPAMVFFSGSPDSLAHIGHINTHFTDRIKTDQPHFAPLQDNNTNAFMPDPEGKIPEVAASWKVEARGTGRLEFVPKPQEHGRVRRVASTIARRIPLFR